MNIPTFQNVRYVDENGYLTSQMALYNDELNRSLQDGLSNNGWTLPVVDVETLTKIIALTGERTPPDGSMWYLHDAGIIPPAPIYEMIIKINGAYKKVTTTAYP